MAPHLFRLMSPEDQKLYGQTTITVRKLDRHASTKTATAERKEQASFANWLFAPEFQTRPEGENPLCLARDTYALESHPGHARFLGRDSRQEYLDRVQGEQLLQVDARAGGVPASLRSPEDRMGRRL